MKCPHCKKDISDKEIAKHLGRVGGKVKNEKRAAASRINGMLGGRPRKIMKEDSSK